MELAPPLLAALIAGVFPRIQAGLWALPSRVLRFLAPNGRRAIVSSALLAFLICIALSWARPPRPLVHDEFAYLLAADTFARGRLTNPTHPMWRHFESFHIIQRPTYQAKYPPAQGLAIAPGQALTGHAIVGVWMGMAACAAAVCWMMLAWAPPRWALFAGLMPALRFGTAPLWDTIWFGYWSTTYWGGAVALAGGAMLFGALPRLRRNLRARDAIILAAGLVVLANSRPYEGFVAALPAAVLIAGWLLTHRSLWRPALVRAVPAAMGVLALGAAAMGFYNYRVTGDFLKPPYVVYNDEYDIIPLFSFQRLKPDKTYNFPEMRDLQHGFMLDAYNRSKAGFTASDVPRYAEVVVFLFGYTLLPALLWLLLRLFDRWVVFALIVLAVSVVANKLVTTMRLQSHYLAPAIPWIIFLAVEALRRARAFQVRGRRVGRALVEAMLATCLLSLVAGCVVHRLRLPRGLTHISQYRPEIEKQLKSAPGNDLVLVRYDPSHPLQDWVYNGADLDGAPIVWARDLGPEKNRELFDYYSDRRIWELAPNKLPPDLLKPMNR